MEHQKNYDKDQPKEKEFVEKLVKLNRTAKVVKGGRRFSFSALTVVGDKKGRVGFGFGKANDVTEAIRKSIDKAKRNLINVPIKNGTIPHEIQASYKSSSVLLKPACSGTALGKRQEGLPPSRRDADVCLCGGVDFCDDCLQQYWFPGCGRPAGVFGCKGMEHL